MADPRTNVEQPGPDSAVEPPSPEASPSPEAPEASPAAGAPGPRRRRPVWMTALIVAGILALVCSGGVLVGAWLLTNRYESKVERADILRDVPRPTAPVTDTSPMNFLVLGSDSRSAQARGFDATGDRSDTIMVVHINEGRQGAFIVSIPRDSYVYVPPAGSWPGGLNKINSAMAFGGAAHAARTVYELTKIPLNGAFVVNFEGIERMVGVVGTIHVCIPYDVDSRHTDRYWSAGCHDMGPEETQDFVRQRYSVPGGDFGRIHDQQLVVRALASQLAHSGMLTNPIDLDRLITIAAESVTADQDTDLRELALDLRGIDPDAITFATTPWTRTMQTDAGSSVELDMAAAQELFQSVIDDRTDEWLAAHPQELPQPI